MLARVWTESLAAIRQLGRELGSGDSYLPTPQIHTLLRETLGLLSLIAVAGSSLIGAIGGAVSPTTLALGFGAGALLLGLRLLVGRVSDNTIAGIFLVGSLGAAAVLGLAVRTPQSVHLLLVGLPMVFTTFVFGARLGPWYIAGVGAIALGLAASQGRGGPVVALDPWGQAVLMIIILVILYVLAVTLRRHVARTHREASESLARQARAEGAAQVQARLELALRAGRFGVWEFDAPRDCLSFDARAAELLGLPATATELGVDEWRQCLLPDDRDPTVERVRQWMREGGHLRVRYRVRHPDGEVRWLSAETGVGDEPTAAARRVVGMLSDVTDDMRLRERMEDALRRSEEAISLVRGYFFDVDLRSGRLTRDRRAGQLLGLPAEDRMSDQYYGTLMARLDPAERNRLADVVRQAMNSDADRFDIEVPIREAPEPRYLRVLGRIERDAAGKARRIVGMSVDVTEDRASHERLREANDRLGLALSGAHASVWTFDASSDTEAWDERGVSLYGRDPSRIGRREALAIDADRPGLRQEIERLRADPEVRSVMLEYRIEHPAVGIRWVRCIGRVDRDAAGACVGAAGIDLDVTAERTATEAIEQARRAAEDASQAKSAFLANMSHEIRTPMNAIIGMTGLAHRAQTLAQASSYSAQAHSAARSLLTVLNDVLDLSKIEAGRLDVESVRFSLEQVLGPVIDVVSFNAAQQGLELMLDVDAGTRSHYVGDPARIGQVLLNLASNAVKFTAKGFVRVRVTHTATGRLRFEVSDSGPGMAESAQRQIFEPFVQGDASTSRRFGGTGLGLTISRRLIDLMRGEIGVQSSPGKGSTFWFELPQPLALAEPSIWGEGSQPTGSAALLHRDPMVARCLVDQLRHAGAQAVAVEDVATLSEWLQGQPSQSRPLVVLDHRWLGGEAEPALARLRHLPCAPRLVLLGRRLSSLPTGEVAVLEPVLPSQWRELLRPLADRTPADAAVDASGPRPAPVPPGSLAGVDVLLVEDNDLNRALVLAILADTGARVRIAENGVQALEAIGQAWPDVVLMDIHMPVMDGYAATAAIRALGPRGRELPILATTADALVGDRDRALRAGMNDHLVKPIDPAALLATLMRWTHAERASSGEGVPAGLPERATAQDRPADASGATAPAQAAPERPAPPMPAASSAWEGLALIDTTEGLKGCLGRTTLFEQGLKIFLDVYGPKAAELRSSPPEADTGETGPWRRLAHTLKGSVRSLGMMRLASEAARLDAELRAGEPWNEARRDALLSALDATLAEARELRGRLAGSAEPVAEPQSRNR